MNSDQFCNFHNKEDEFNTLINQIKNPDMKKIYQYFNFSYIDFSNNSKDIIMEKTITQTSYLQNFLGSSKFFTINMYPLTKKQTRINLAAYKQSATDIFTNVTICSEQKCLIIESINKNEFLAAISGIQAFFIDTSEGSNLSQEIKKEINSFTHYFKNYIQENDFFLTTIRPIGCYLIRRFYLTSNNFQDSSFFSFNHNKNTKENEFKTKFIEFFKNQSNLEKDQSNQILDFVTNIEKDFKNEEEEINEEITYFDMNKFIEIKIIDGYHSVVFHVETMRVFLIKKLDYSINAKNNQREIDFCINYQNNCFMKFYGFVKSKKNDKIIYQFLCNNTLSSKVKYMNEFHLFPLIIRLFRGISYLHSHSLIHRDLHSLNILFDNDFRAYITDFETIRKINQEKEQKDFFTYDFGKIQFASPEQMEGNPISFSTDIYSFGKIIEFIINNNPNNYFFPEIKKYLSNLYHICTKENPEERATLDEIKNCIHEILTYFYNKDQSYLYLILQNNQIDEMYHFLYENFLFSFKYKKIKKIDEFIIFNILNSIRCNNPNQLQSELFTNLGVFYYNNKEYDLARPCFEQAVQLNNSDALNYLGIYYKNGINVDKNYNLSFQYFQRSAEQNNPAAYYNLGQAYYYGFGVEKNYSKAIEYYELSVKQDYVEAIIQLAYCYLAGVGVEVNLKKAIEYYEYLEPKNNIKALFNLGIIYFNGGDGIQKDYKKSKYYFEKSAEQNNSESYFYLGLQYYNGFGVDKNLNKAKECYEKASELNNLKATNNLGLMYLEGYGVTQDFEKAKEYFEIGAKQNDASSINNIGNIYNKTKNYKKAFQYYERAAQLGVAISLTNLGTLYLNGQGVEQDYLKALEYYEKAALQNEPTSYYNLGIMYEKGFGVDQSYEKARECYEKIENQNLPDVFYNLGQIYQLGLGVEKDLYKAKRYHEKAAKLGHAYSLFQIAILYYIDSGIEINYFLAKHYFDLAAEYNIPEAYVYLMRMYAYGEGVEKDFSKVSKYMELYCHSSLPANKPAAYFMLGSFYEDDEHQDYFKARSYLEISSEMNYPLAKCHLGLIHLNGLGVKKNYLKAIDYFEKSAIDNIPESFFYLGFIYENGKGVDIDILKAVEYYKKCADTKSYISILNSTDMDLDNSCYYRSNNDIGLIYITELQYQNIELASDYIKIAGLNEYPFGQNSLGLLHQYYKNFRGDSIHLFTKASKNKFVLSEFNLANLYEEEGNEKEAIKYYEKVSIDEDEPFVFKGDVIHDERLEISKILIVCFTNLKLTQYYLQQQRINNARDYFIKAIFQPLFRLLYLLDDESYTFLFKYKIKNRKIIFSNLKDFIFKFPLFNFSNGNVNSETGWIKNKKGTNEIILESQYIVQKYKENKEFQETIKYIFDNMNKKNKFTLLLLSQNEIRIKSKNEEIERCLYFSNFLYYMIFEDIEQIKEEIDDVIDQLKTILFEPPYPILFGRMIVRPKKKEVEKKIKEINYLFYEGFGISLV